MAAPFEAMPADAEDHAVGVELQIVELVEQQERATVQGHPEEAAELQPEIDELQRELAATAEHIAPLVN